MRTGRFPGRRPVVVVGALAVLLATAGVAHDHRVRAMRELGRCCASAGAALCRPGSGSAPPLTTYGGISVPLLALLEPNGLPAGV